MIPAIITYNAFAPYKILYYNTLYGAKIYTAENPGTVTALSVAFRQLCAVFRFSTEKLHCLVEVVAVAEHRYAGGA